nr:hypothetical protein [Pseudoxanthomonas sp.]
MKQFFVALIMMCTSCHVTGNGSLAGLGTGEKDMLAGVRPDHILEAWGGEIHGKDLGEWGGEVTFREQNGHEYQLIDDNSRGIFDMPYGVIAITGLAHLGENRGSVYVIRRGNSTNRVTATKTLTLPGWPCETIASKNEIMLRVFRGYGPVPDRPSSPLYACYSLQSPSTVQPTVCPAVIPEGCFH